MPKPIPKSPALCNKEMNELKQSREDAAQHLYLPIETGEVQKGSLSIYMPTFIHSVHGGMEENDSQDSRGIKRATATEKEMKI